MNVDFRNDDPCGHCGLRQLKVGRDELDHYEGVDPCLGLLPDVTQACCAHGGTCDTESFKARPYVVISPGDKPGTMSSEARGEWRALHGQAALDWFAERGVGPSCFSSEPELRLDQSTEGGTA